MQSSTALAVREYVCNKEFEILVETCAGTLPEQCKHPITSEYNDETYRCKFQVLYRVTHGILHVFRYKALLSISHNLSHPCMADLLYFERYGDNFENTRTVAECKNVMFTNDGIHMCPHNFGGHEPKNCVQIGVRVRLLEKRTKAKDLFDGTLYPSDVALVVEGERFPVNKGYLSVISPVFATMFSSDFIERDAAEIPIEDTTAADFHDFLNAIYPTRTAPNPSNVLSLLTLADRFQVDNLTDKCARRLMSCDEIAPMVKLLYAERLDLPNLKNYVVNKVSAEEIEGIKKDGRFTTLTIPTISQLFDNYINLKSS
jgi:hypothetical protein